MPKPKRGGLPTPAYDRAQGQFYRELGWKRKEDGNYRQHKFYLGSNRADAQTRYLRLDQVWTRVEKHWHEFRGSEKPLWDDTTLAIAKAVSRGESVARIDVPPEVIAADDDPATIAAWLHLIREQFSGIIVVALVDQELEAQGLGYWDNRSATLEDQGNKLIQQANDIRKDFHPEAKQTLHQALDAYCSAKLVEYTTPSGISTTGQVLKKEIPFLKEHIKDMPLSSLDLDAIEHIEDYFARRPLSKRNKPLAVKTVSNILKRLRNFWRWLHRAKAWSWRKPEDYEVRALKIFTTQQERAKRINGVEYYTDDELVLLWKHAKPRERLYMLLALNCGFGIAEISSLLQEEISFNVKHPRYGTVGSYIRRIRGKSDVAGDWLLWDETVQGLEWYISTRPATKESCLIVNKDGIPVSRQTSGGNRAQVIANDWFDITKRVQTHENANFRKLSFNKLRKTAIQMCEEVSGSGETAGYFASHGSPVPSDLLLDVYRGRDYRRVHEACTLMRKRLQAMFASVPEPFVKQKRKHAPRVDLSEIRHQVVDLRNSGKTYQEISVMLNISIGSVRNHLAKHAL